MGYFQSSAGPRFELGRTVATAGITHLIGKHGINPVDYLARHHHGDWGDLDDGDKQLNEEALSVGNRILSKYHIPIPGQATLAIYIITEWDRSLTTILLVSEY